MGNSALHSRVLVLGIDGAGKTSFLNKFQNPDEETPVEPTEAYVIRDLKFKGVKFNVWDVSGKESTRSLWKHYYSEGGTDAVIWVVDSASSDERLKESQQLLASAMMDPSLTDVMLMVLFNKQDLEGARTKKELKEIFNIKALKEKRTVKVHCISAITGEGIRDAMNKLAKELKTENKKKN